MNLQWSFPQRDAVMVAIPIRKAGATMLCIIPRGRHTLCPEANRLLAHTNVKTLLLCDKGCGKPCNGPCRRFRSTRKRTAKERCPSLDHDTTPFSMPLVLGTHPFWFSTVSVITAAITGTMVKSLEILGRGVCVWCVLDTDTECECPMLQTWKIEHPHIVCRELSEPDMPLCADATVPGISVFLCHRHA